mmetsp:Transcript_40864/g.91680  ORF Transcript_40864/g.91680 Transcript_40864/m.91680 type:complete len:242 (-) Transcript_40864:235-960(-)
MLSRRFSSLKLTAIFAPARALFLMSSMLTRNDSPPVSSLILRRRNGVASLPVTRCSAASDTACSVAFSMVATSAANSCCIGLPMTSPEVRPKRVCAAMTLATSSSVAQEHGTGRPDEGVKKAGKVLVRKPMTTTPCVSKYSSVLGMSRMDFAPAQTTATGVRPSSVRSAETSQLSSAPRWTPPMPPVTKTRMPAMCAINIVAATVVAPLSFIPTAFARSRRDTFSHGVCPNKVSSSSVIPT